MTEAQLDRAFAELRRGSQASLVLMLVGVLFLLGSVYYAATRLRPLEQEITQSKAEIKRLEADKAEIERVATGLKQAISQRKAEVERLAAEEAEATQRIVTLQREYATLKASTEELYAVRVTPDNQVYELKATAQATGRTIGSRAEYQFAIYVNSPLQTLESIRSVEYRFDHPTFDQKQIVATDVGNHFRVRYDGWGCLNRVDVTVTLKDATAHRFDFNMCRSLGSQWGTTDAFPSRGAFPGKQAPAANKLNRLPDMATPPRLPPPSSVVPNSIDPTSNQVDKRPDSSDGN